MMWHRGGSSGEPKLWHSDLEFEYAKFHQLKKNIKAPEIHEPTQTTSRKISVLSQTLNGAGVFSLSTFLITP